MLADPPPLPLTNLGPVSSAVQVQDRRYVLVPAADAPPVVVDDATGVRFRLALRTGCTADGLRFPLVLASCPDGDDPRVPAVADLRARTVKRYPAVAGVRFHEAG